MLRDVTYTFWSQNYVQDCAVRPFAVAAVHRKVIWPVIMATGRRSKRSKVKGHVGTAIQHSYLGRNKAAPWPRRCAPWSGFAWSVPNPHAGSTEMFATHIRNNKQNILAVLICWSRCNVLRNPPEHLDDHFPEEAADLIRYKTSPSCEQQNETNGEWQLLFGYFDKGTWAFLSVATPPFTYMHTVRPGEAPLCRTPHHRHAKQWHG